MSRLGSPNLNASFHPGALPDTKGKSGVLAVEFLSADPQLTQGVPRAWFNTTSNLLKISDDGTNTYVFTPST